VNVTRALQPISRRAIRGAADSQSSFTLGTKSRSAKGTGRIVNAHNREGNRREVVAAKLWRDYVIDLRPIDAGIVFVLEIEKGRAAVAGEPCFGRS